MFTYPSSNFSNQLKCIYLVTTSKEVNEFSYLSIYFYLRLQQYSENTVFNKLYDSSLETSSL